MSLNRTAATVIRVVEQLGNDPRSVALLLVAPTALMSLLAWIVTDADFDQYGSALLGIFPLITMFLVTSVATLRERRSGTLERLLSMPISKADFVFGYALAFGAFAIAQALVVAAVSFGPLGLDVNGSASLLVLVAILDAVLGTALGLFVSAFATTEFQAVQFMPAVILPQLLLCGVVTAREDLPPALRWISDVLPLSYAIDATKEVIANSSASSTYWASVAIVCGFGVVALCLGAATLRRRTA